MVGMGSVRGGWVVGDGGRWMRACGSWLRLCLCLRACGCGEEGGGLCSSQRLRALFPFRSPSPDRLLPVDILGHPHKEHTQGSLDTTVFDTQV